MDEISFDIVGFDLDGTLIDTSGDLTNAVNHALEDAGRPALSVDQVATMIGGGAKHMLSQALDATGGCEPGEMRRLYKVMLGFYSDHIAVESIPYPGAVKAIDALHARGIKTAIVTNKFEAFAEALLSQLGLRNRFTCVIGGDTMGKGLSKPHRAPIDEMVRRCGGGRAAFVGDSIYDIMAARNAGIPSVAAAFGFLHQPVESLGADAILHQYEDLVPTLAQLAPRLR